MLQLTLSRFAIGPDITNIVLICNDRWLIVAFLAFILKSTNLVVISATG